MSRPPPAAGAPYTFELEQRRGYLRVVMLGTRSTLDASIAGWRAIGALVRERKARCVMVVSRLGGPEPSAEEQMKTVHALAGAGFEGVRLAFILEDSARLAALEHGEIYARELGHDTRVFGTEALAEVWLRHGGVAAP